MANSFDQFDAPASPSGQANPFDKFDAPAAKPVGFVRKAADLGLGFASGALGATKSVSDAAGAGNAVSGALDSADKFVQSGLSDQAVADQQEQQAILKESQGKGVYEGLKSAGKAFAVAPVQTAVTGLGSVVPTIAAGLATGGASVPVSLGAMAAMGVAQGAGSIKGGIYDDIKQRSAEAKIDPAAAEAAALKAQEYGGPNTGQIALGAALGMGDSVTGVSKIATSMLRKGVGKGAQELAEGSARGFVARAALGAAGEVPLEAAQGGQQQYASNVASQREGFAVNPWDNVVSQGAFEGLASAGPGAAFGALHGRSAPVAPVTQEAALQVNPGEPAPAPDATPPGLGFNPSAGTHTVFPDGSVILNSDRPEGEQAVFDKRFAPQAGTAAAQNAPAATFASILDTDPVYSTWSNVQDGTDRAIMRDQMEYVGRTYAGKATDENREALNKDLSEQFKWFRNAAPEQKNAALDSLFVQPAAAEPTSQIDTALSAAEANIARTRAEWAAAEQRAKRIAVVGVADAPPNSPLTSAAFIAVDSGAHDAAIAQQNQAMAQAGKAQPTTENVAASPLTAAAESVQAPAAAPAPTPQERLAKLNSEIASGTNADTGAKLTPFQLGVRKAQANQIVSQLPKDAPAGAQPSNDAPSQAPQAQAAIESVAQPQGLTNAKTNETQPQQPKPEAAAAAVAGAADEVAPSRNYGDRLPPEKAMQLQEANRALGRDVTRQQVQGMRDRVAGEIASGQTNNGGVMASLKPAAIAQRKEQLSRLDQDLALFDGAPAAQNAATPKLNPIQAAAVAKQKGIDTTGMKPAQVVAAIAQADAAPAGPAHLGRNNQPLSEGGKAYKTSLAARDAKKLQPMMRVVAVKGGFALAEKTEKQVAAEAKAARRLRNPQTSPPGEPIPAHAFIAAEGGLHKDTRPDMNIGANPKIGNRTLFAGKGKGISMERATARLIEEGYLSEGASHNEAAALIKRSLTKPQHNADGIERIAIAEEEARYAAYDLEMENGIVEAEALDDNEFDALDNDIPWDEAGQPSSYADFLSATGATEQEIQNEIASESGISQASSESSSRPIEAAASDAQAGDGQRAPAQGQDEGLSAEKIGEFNDAKLRPATSGIFELEEGGFEKFDGIWYRGESTPSKALKAEMPSSHLRPTERLPFQRWKRVADFSLDAWGSPRALTNQKKYAVPETLTAPSQQDVIDQQERAETGRTAEAPAQGEEQGLTADQQAVEQIRTAELSYATTKRLAAAYRGEAYKGVSEDYQTLRADLEARSSDESFKDRGLARDVLERFDDSTANKAHRDAQKRDTANTEPQAAPINPNSVVAKAQAAKAKKKPTLRESVARAKAARETITPANDKGIGRNSDGETLHQRSDGSIYRMHNGRPDFGGDLVPLAAQSTQDAQSADSTTTPGQQASTPAELAQASADLAELETEYKTARGQRRSDVGQQIDRMRAAIAERKTPAPVRPKSVPEQARATKAAQALDGIDVVNQGEGRYVELQGASEATYKKYGATLKIGNITTGNAWLIGIDDYLENSHVLKKYAVTTEVNRRKSRLKAIFDGVIDVAGLAAENSPASSATEATAQPDTLAAVLAKQLPDMTDAELQQAQVHYPADHARAPKVTKEINRRALVAKLKPAAPAQGQEQRLTAPTFAIKLERGQNTLRGNPQFHEAEAYAKTLPQGDYALVTIDRAGIYNNSAAEPTRYGAWVSNGDGSASFVENQFPASREPLTDAIIAELYEAATKKEQSRQGKMAAANQIRLEQIKSKKLRIGAEWADAQTYVAGKTGMTTFSKSKITSINEGGFLTVQSTLRGSNRLYKFTVDADSRLFDNYPTLESLGLTAPSKQDILSQQARTEQATQLDEKAQIDREAGKQTLTRQAAPEQRTDTSGDMFAMEKATAEIEKRNAGVAAAKDPNQGAMFSRPARSVLERGDSETAEILALKAEISAIKGRKFAITKGFRARGSQLAELAALPDEAPLVAQLWALEAAAAAQLLPKKPVVSGYSQAQVDSPAFRRWFGKDGIRDDEGKPKIFTHSGDPGLEVISGDKGRFNGIFVLPGQANARYRDKTYHLYMKGLIVGNPEIQAFFDDSPEDAAAVASEALGKSITADEMDKVQKLVLSEVATDEDAPILNSYDAAEGYAAMQRVRGAIAKHLGATAVKIDDEFGGDSLLVVDGTKVKSTENNGDFDPANPNIHYSKSAKPAGSMAQDQVQAIADRIAATWKNAPEIIVAQNMADPRIPQAARDEDQKQRSLGAADTTEGFFYEGKVYLLADGLTSPSSVAEVLLHESVGHYGMRGAFGDLLTPILQQMATMRKAEVTAKAKQYGLDMNVAEDRLIAAEEVLAELAQSQPNLNFVQRAIAAIRTWLRKHMPMMSGLKLTDAEIVANVLIPARRFVERGDRAQGRGRASFSRGTNEAMTNSENTIEAEITSLQAEIAGIKARQFAITKGVRPRGAQIAELAKIPNPSPLEARMYALQIEQINRAEKQKSPDDARPKLIDEEDLPPTPDGYTRRFHGSYESTLKNDGTGGMGFGGIFTTGTMKNNGYGSGFMYYADIPNDSVSDRSFSEKPEKEILEALKAAMGKQYNPAMADEIWQAVIDDVDMTERGSLLYSDDAREAEANATKAFSGLDAFNKGIVGAAAWEAQKIRIRVGNMLGYKAIPMRDDTGTSWVVLPGIDFHPAFAMPDGPIPPNGSTPMFSRASAIGDTLKAALNSTKETTVGSTGRYTAAQLQAMRNIGATVTEPSLKERAEALWKDMGKKMAQGLADQFAPIKELDEKAYNLLRLSKGASGAFESLLRGGKLKLTDNVYDFDESQRGGVIDKLLTPLQGEHHDALRWVAANRAERLMNESEATRAEGVKLLAEAVQLDADARALGNQAKQYLQQAGNFPKSMTGNQQAQKANEVEANKLMAQAERVRKEAAEKRKSGNDKKNISRENLFTREDIAAFKTLTDGTTGFDYTIQNGTQKGEVTRDRAAIYRDFNANLNAFNANVLDMATQSGLIDPESRKLWESEFYVPFYRVADESDGGVRGMNIGSVVRQQPFKTLKGGKQALQADLLDNVLMNWAHLLDASAKNRAAKASLEAAEKMGVAVSAPEATVRNMAGTIGKKNNVVWFMDEGKPRHFLIDDPYVMTALTALEYAGMRNPAMNAMSAFKHALTIGVTASPFFKIRNLIRDSVQVIAAGPIGYNPATNIKQGWALTDPKSDAYFRLLAGGGTIHFGTMMEGNEAKRVQALVESGVKDFTILDGDHKVKAFYRKFIEPGVTAYNELGNRGEAINRAALYDQLIKQGVGHAEASLQARDLMDFSMQGSFTAVRFLTQVVPFMNARIQGLYKLGRAAKEDPRRLSAVLGAVALVSLTLLAAYSDDDDWKKREEWDRNNFWWFKFGGTAFRIPKPFEVGAIGTLAERGAELFFDKEMTNKRFMEQVLTLLSDNLAMNPVPQMFKPMLDVYANKDSFSGRPIESLGMEKLKPEYRFNGRTSMTARATSTALNSVTGLVGQESLSPVQVDHMLRGYFGWLGSFVVGTADVIARTMTNQPGQAAPDYWKTATGGIASSLEGAPSRYVSQIYQQAKEIEQAYGTWRALMKEGKAGEAETFREKNQESIAKYRQIEHIKKQTSALNQRVKQIEQSDLSGDEKRAQILRIRNQQNLIAKLAVAD